MWFALAFFAIGFLATALLMPKPKIENARASTLGDFSFPRSKEGDPLGIVQGTVRLRSPNTIWTGNFKSVPITRKVKTGLFSSKKQVIGYKYYIGMDLSLCLGPNVVLKKIWFGKKVVWEGSLATEGTIVLNDPELYGGEDRNGGIGGTVAFYPGNLTQSQDSYLATHIGEGAPRYNGVCHLVFRDFWFGNSTSIDAINVEVQCLHNSLGLGGEAVMPNGLDLNPIEGLYDLYVNNWGRLGVNPLSIDTDSFRTAGSTVYAEGNGMSLEIARSNTGSDLSKEILRQVNGILYQDVETAKIRLKLIRRDYDAAELVELTPSSVKAITNFTKKLWEETFNQVRVKFRNRENDYADAAALWQDFANINFQNRVRGSEVSFPGIFDPAVANMVAAREGSEVNVPLFQIEFEANRKISSLRPGDCFRMSWPEYGMSDVVMRIRTFDTGELKNGAISVMATQDEFSSDAITFADPVPTLWDPPDLLPSEIDEGVVMEVPTWFQRKTEYAPLDQALMWALARRPGLQSQGFNVNTSQDAFATSEMPNENVLYQGSALLESNYDITTAFANGFDASGTGIVIDMLDGAFIPTTATDSDIKTLGVNLMRIGDEIIAYRTVTSLGAGRYRLTNLHRCMVGTIFRSHAAGDVVWFLSSVDGVTPLGYPNTASYDVRLQDRAPQGTWPLADADTISVTFGRLAERPLVPNYLQVDGSRTAIIMPTVATAITWVNRNRMDDALTFFNDATVTPEGGQETRLRYSLNGGMSWTVLDLSGTSTTIDTTAATSGLFLQAYGLRGGLVSAVYDELYLPIFGVGGYGNDYGNNYGSP